MKIEDRKFVVLVLCRDCKSELNKTCELTFNQLYDAWGQLVMSSGLVTGRCKKGCRSTFSDLNINTDLEVRDVGTDKPVAFETLKICAGHFYDDDRDDTCTCDPGKDQALNVDELYETKDYPSVHGKCGKFIKPYTRA